MIPAAFLCFGSSLLFAGGQTEASTSTKEAYTYTDAAGRQVSLAAKPQKIVATYLPLWEALTMLGVKPIGANNADDYIKTWPAFENIDMSGIVDIGAKAPNLELLAELQPDLILHQVMDSKNPDLGNLDKVAPVAVFGPETKFDWRLALREVAKAIGEPEKAEAAIANVDSVLAKARSGFVNSYKDKTFMLISLMGVDRLFYTYRSDIYDSETGLGLKTPEGFVVSQKFESLPLEKLAQMNPDYIFLNVISGGEAAYDQLSNNPVWQKLKAVQSKQFSVIPGPGHAISPLSTEYTVNFIINALK